jgi:hypothetical protein
MTVDKESQDKLQAYVVSDELFMYSTTLNALLIQEQADDNPLWSRLACHRLILKRRSDFKS